MPIVDWGIGAEAVDDFDRDSQFKPYAGPVPPNAVYQWRIKIAKFVDGTKDKWPQLRLGLELVPRSDIPEEKRYKNYFVMFFGSITPDTAFNYAPFCDAIGVTGREFARKTQTDEEGNIRRIGNWRNDGKTLILGQLTDKADQNGNPRKTIGWMGPVDTECEADDDEPEDDEAF